MGRSPLGLLASLLLMSSLNLNCVIQDLFTNKKSDDNSLLLAALLLSSPRSSCSSVSYPGSQVTTQSGYGAGSGFSVLTGRILTQSGSPVIAANVVAVNQVSSTAFIATFSGLGADGSFYLSGVSPSTNFQLAVEPIGTDFSGRIDSFIDCYRTPSSFTPGWYGGTGVTISGTASTFSSPATGSVQDLGTIRIPE